MHDEVYSMVKQTFIRELPGESLFLDRFAPVRGNGLLNWRLGMLHDGEIDDGCDRTTVANAVPNARIIEARLTTIALTEHEDAV